MTGVNAQLDVHFNSLIELSGSSLDDQSHSVGYVILNTAIDQLSAVFILFTSKQCNFLLSGDSE